MVYNPLNLERRTLIEQRNKLAADYMDEASALKNYFEGKFRRHMPTPFFDDSMFGVGMAIMEIYNDAKTYSEKDISSYTDEKLQNEIETLKKRMDRMEKASKITELSTYIRNDKREVEKIGHNLFSLAEEILASC